MYRIVVFAIFCMACNPHGHQRQQPASNHYLSFFKDSINPLLNNLEATAAKRKLDSILPFVKKEDNYVDRCSWLRCMTVVYQLEKKPDSARLFINQALQLALARDTTQRQVLAGKIQTAGVLLDANSPDSALHYALEAYALAQKIDTPGLPFICLKLYDIYEKIGDLEMQRKYLFEGFSRSTNHKHKTVFATNISAWYERVNQVDSALLFFQALMKDSSFSNPYYNAVRYNNLGTLLSKKGRLTEGLAYQLKGMPISRELGELDAQVYYNIAATYRKLGEYNLDEHLLDTALTLVTQENNWALEKKIWRAKAENGALQQKPWLAYAALDSAFAYYQKEVDSSIIGRARELEAKYSLLEKDNQIKSLALSNQQSERNRERQIIAIITVVVIIGILLFFVWKEEQFERMISEERLRQQLLSGQINYHFLYSSITGLQKLIGEKNTERALAFSEQLAELFMLSLENARQPNVLLRDELQALANYLALQQDLFLHTFDYHIDVEEVIDQEAILILPMLLQPFIENAILHGFNGLTYKGQITVQIRMQEKALHCIIEDNGRGMQCTDIPSKKRPWSTIINKERLKILTRQANTPAQLNIIDKKGSTNETGVRVELIIPYQTRKN